MRKLHAMAALATIGTLGLTSCTSAPPAPDEPTSEVGRFVACLKAAGVAVRISERSGQVMVRDTSAQTEPAGDPSQGISAGSGEAGTPALMVEGDADGTRWVAAADAGYFVKDPETQDAYTACEREHPDFRQPQYTPSDDPGLQADLAKQQEAALAFARCARDAGFAWVADPDPQTGSIALPDDLAEDEYRSLLTACWDTKGPGFGWQVDGKLGFDWLAVLEEVNGGTNSGANPVDVTPGTNR